MPIQAENHKYYDFEELYFEKVCDINSIINNFFIKYITYKIKKLIEEDRNFLNRIKGEGQDLLNRIGKVSYLKSDYYYSKL